MARQNKTAAAIATLTAEHGARIRELGVQFAKAVDAIRDLKPVIVAALDQAGVKAMENPRHVHSKEDHRKKIVAIREAVLVEFLNAPQYIADASKQLGRPLSAIDAGVLEDLKGLRANRTLGGELRHPYNMIYGLFNESGFRLKAEKVKSEKSEASEASVASDASDASDASAKMTTSIADIVAYLNSRNVPADMALAAAQQYAESKQEKKAA